jgi:nucleoside-diphosphate-sugar epimerase
MLNQNLNYYKNKKILVTGATGFIGFSLIKKLSAVSCSIIAIKEKKFIYEKIPNCKANVLVKDFDITDKDFWKESLEGIDIVFHFAAQTSLRVATNNPLLDIEINVLPIVNFIETCQKYKFAPDILFSGTVTEVGMTSTIPVDENFKDLPITVYDINKLAAEKYLQYYSNQLGHRAVILRLSNVYGPGPISSSVDRGILNMMVRKAINNEDLVVYGDGNYIRDYVYIDDVISAFLMAGAKIDIAKGNYYIVGTGIGYTIIQMAELVVDRVYRKTGIKVNIKKIDLPNNLSQIETRNFVANVNKIKRDIKWHAEVQLEDGIDKTIDFFIQLRDRQNV